MISDSDGAAGIKRVAVPGAEQPAPVSRHAGAGNSSTMIQASDLRALGRQDGAFLFETFEKLIFEGNAAVSAKFDVFDTWFKLQMLECEFRMAGAGVADDQIKIWQDACTEEMRCRCVTLREQMLRVQ